MINNMILDAIIRANQLKFAGHVYEYSMQEIHRLRRYSMLLPELHRMNNRVLYLALEDTLPG